MNKIIETLKGIVSKIIEAISGITRNPDKMKILIGGAIVVLLIFSIFFIIISFRC